MMKFVQCMSVAAVVAVLTVLGLGAIALVRPAAAADLQAGSAAAVAHGGGGFHSEAGLEAAAAALGMTVDELRTQLWAGESLADLADEAGVDLQVVQDAVTAANEAATRDAIAQAVDDGTITQAHADWLIEGLEAGYWGGSDGFGFGPRGFRGPGRLPFGDTAPATVTPDSNT